MVKFRHMSALVECSTGSTPNVETVKRYIDFLSQMGYNELYLGCTDAYKIEGEPYFNYKRGGYTTEDFREMDEYAISHGIELIANIQTLGHLHFIRRHASYADMMDNDNILMVGDERVYALIDKMFAAISAGLSSRRIHIGFDECWGLGQGNYQLKNGPADAKVLLLQHMKRVVEIAEKYGYQCEIWHDMLLDKKNTSITPADVKASLPENVIVHYWEYFESDYNILNDNINNLKRYADSLRFAGSIIKCSSMCPMISFSRHRLIPQMKAAYENGMDGFMVTLWCNQGAWVSNFGALPGLFECAEYNLGNWDGTGEIDKDKFRRITGCSYDAMLSFEDLDNPLHTTPPDSHSNRSYFILLADLLNGSWDMLLNEKTPEGYRILAEKYRFYRKNGECGEFDYLFRWMEKLACVLEYKSLLGKRIRCAYKENNTAGLIVCLEDIIRLETALDEFISAHEELWIRENFIFGLEVNQTFLGGLRLRLSYFEKRLHAYLNDGTPVPELQYETILPDIPKGSSEDNLWVSEWVNLISNVNFIM